MKASLKFREDQKPLLRAKIPLSILGFPFQSAIAAGTSKDLTLNLSTLFDSGPSFNLSYRPNDSSNPFSLLVKTGIGALGSPISSPFHMTADFNLIARGNPSFMLHFNPKLGDFSFKKSQSSAVFHNPLKSESESEESPDIKAAVSKVVSGVDVSASTTVPVLRCAAVRFRWGLRVPAMSGGGGGGGISIREAPFMVLDKIAIEHVDGGDLDSKEGNLGNGDLELEMGRFGVKRQFEILERENGLMKKGIEDLRKQMKLFSKSGEFDRKGGRRFAAFDGLPTEESSTAGGEELRKAAMSSLNV